MEKKRTSKNRVLALVKISVQERPPDREKLDFSSHPRVSEGEKK